MKIRKSAGVRVSLAVHRLIRQGNAARDRRDWQAAVAAYRAALAADPSLRHIRIQLGHALKESGLHAEAVDAYESAYAQDPAHLEPLFLLAELSRALGDRRGVAKYLVRAIGSAGGDPRSASDLRTLTMFATVDGAALARAARDLDEGPSASDRHRPATVATLDRVLHDAATISDGDRQILRSARDVLSRIEDGATPDVSSTASGVVFDVTDLIGHYRHHRLPTGIQRVQIEVVTRALADSGQTVRICCFVSWQNALVDIPNDLFVDLAAASTAGSDSNAPEWQAVTARLVLHLAVAEAFAFRTGDRLVNLGTSWWIYDYFLLIRNAKREHGISYIPFVHDLIPITAREYCVDGVVEDYVSWLIGVFHHADGFLVNSESTGRDLVEVAGRLGHRMSPDMIEVVPLDADFRRSQPAEQPLSGLARWSISAGTYCLLVSTIEARKNHVLALDAWARLIEAHGPDAVPRLVCVGRNGWLNSAFYERLLRNPELRKHVTVIDRVSDTELALLYQGCAFTVYPSHYEGWGLPVTESLCYGKVPVIADNSSLTEAGAGLAVVFATDSVDALVDAVQRVWFDAAYRAQLETAIAAGYRPRPWAVIAAQVMRAVTVGWRDRPPVSIPPAETGRYYPVSLHKGLRVWPGLGSGEIFRAGSGWLWPETTGTRTMPGGGELCVPVDASGSLRLYLRLRGLDSGDCSFSVSVAGDGVAQGVLDRGTERWVIADLPAAADDGVVSILVRGGASEMIEMMVGGAPAKLVASIAVAGFVVLERDDDLARLRFLEQAAFGGPASLSAYAEPGRDRPVPAVA